MLAKNPTTQKQKKQHYWQFLGNNNRGILEYVCCFYPSYSMLSISRLK
jgi:hypothetical protein